MLREKGYATAKDAIGKLRPWSKEGAALSRAAKKKTQSSGSASGSKADANGIMVPLKTVIALFVVLFAAMGFVVVKIGAVSTSSEL